MKGLQRYTIQAMYGLFAGAIGFGWLSEVFTFQLKIYITIGAFVLLGLTLFLQWRWEFKEEEW